MTNSGYTPCACQDCMEIAISSDITKPEMCDSCQESKCEGGESECDAPHTYCPGDEKSAEDYYQAAQDGAPVFSGEDSRDKALAYAEEHNIRGLRQYCGACQQEY